MPKVLVTGYGGFLGSEVTRQLLQRGHQVVGLARGRYPELEELGVEAIAGDIADNDTVRRACRDCQAVVHTAAKAGVWGPRQSYYQVNTLATSQLLTAARQAGAAIFVYTSSPSVTFDGSHQSGVDETAPYPQRWLCAYPETKALAEQEVLDAGRRGALATCALRPHLIWGRGDPHLFPRVIQRAQAGRLRRVGSGQNLIDVVHVTSAAAAHVSALEKLLGGDQSVNGEAFFLTDGKPVECWKSVSQILKTAGVPIPQRSISFAAAYRVGAVLEGLFRVLGKTSEPPMTRFVAAQLAQDHYFCIDKARQRLDYAPSVNTSEELAQCADWLRELAA